METQALKELSYANGAGRRGDVYWSHRLPLLLALLVVMVFARAATCGFTNFDDTAYLTENPHIQEGLSFAGIYWSLTSRVMDLWQPATMLSLQADYQFFGPSPMAFHIHNVVLHACNAVLIYYLLLRLLGEPWRCVLAAAVWAVHPLRVESVAWVVERKDVLSTLFMLLAVHATLRVYEKPSLAFRLVALVCYALSLMAKPMYVTLPVFLLLLDYWPLCRFRVGAMPAGGWSWRGTSSRRPLQLMLEKVPMLVVALLCAWRSIVGTVHHFLGQIQSGGTSIASKPDNLPTFPPDPFIQDESLSSAAANNIVAYVRYVGKQIWFSHLSVIYPEVRWSAAAVVAALLVIVVLTALAIMQARRRPYLTVGWLWFLLIPLPVTNVHKFGPFSMADRYTYFASVGLILAAVWSIPARWFEDAALRRRSVGIAGAVLLVLCAATFTQIGYWTNAYTLYSHALDVTDGNFIAELGIGIALGEAGEHQAAEGHFRRAVAMRPYLSATHKDLAASLVAQNRDAEAVEEFGRAIVADPNGGEPFARIMKPLMKLHRYDDALSFGLQALKRGEDTAMLHAYLGETCAALGHVKEAELEYRKALEIDPMRKDARAYLARVKAAKTP